VGTVYQLIITISILFSQIMGMNSVLGNDGGWPWLLGLTIVPGIIQLLTLPFCPESPKYLLLDKEDEERANSALVWLRGKVTHKLDIFESLSEKFSIFPNFFSDVKTFCKSPYLSLLFHYLESFCS
jgi:SP family facilitated glucose transporter-like MFS transporter 1